jgi:hypothetical protein
LRREPLVDGLQRPEVGIGRVVEELADTADVFDAQHLREIGGRTGFKKT